MSKSTRELKGVTMTADYTIAHGSRLTFRAPGTPPRNMYLAHRSEAGAVMGAMTAEKLDTLYKKGVGRV